MPRNPKTRRSPAVPEPYPDLPFPTAQQCRSVRDDLLSFHGFPKEFERYRRKPPPETTAATPISPEESVLDGLVSTLLSQNTTDANSRRAFVSLKSAFPTWEEVLDADRSGVEKAIRCGGLAATKADRIKNILKCVMEARGKICLEYLRGLSVAEVKAELSRFKGIGPKTSLIKLEGWESMVTVISCDMRCWHAPEKADILVSELLGSFGDNELSPECLDGAQRFLKPDGISIPSSYTSYLQPITTTKLYNDVKSNKDLAHMETPYVVKLHKVARLAPAQPVFTFLHPEFSPNRSNQRYAKLRFEIPPDTGSALVHGFAGYFDAVLYGDIHLSIEPSKATPSMFSWFPIFFPLRTPAYVPSGSHLDVHFWRCCAPSKVWYEWCLTSPANTSPIHNVNGRSYWVGL